MSRNLLDGETSPYLLQHRHNPVHWRPWSEATLTEAKTVNRPILLSIGYAACHWCHVMAHESFEDEATARLINDGFIPVKVDREERPDLDAIYQQALSAMGIPGGWPLTMFLTPAGEPFWGGTYFPAEAHYGRPPFREVLAAVLDAWTKTPERVTDNASALMSHIVVPVEPPQGPPFDHALLDQAAAAVADAVDPVQGGLGGAPKFPQVPVFALLARAGLRNTNARLSGLVDLTLTRMCQGGIYDHLGGGFARYATDERWLVPHFEKMLYDNAQLVELLTLVWQQRRNPLYAERVAETLTWVTREMITEGGAFAATLDADSEGEEGRYYVWTAAEIERALPAELATMVQEVYDVSSEGNWEHGRSVLHRNHLKGQGGDEATLAKARALLLAVRGHRVAPGRDDKVLADWNGMMIAAFAQAGLAFGRADWIATAERAFAACQTILARPQGRLGHGWRLGRLQGEAMLDDYAQMARAALVLAEATGRADYRVRARHWVDIAESDFHDDQGGGYFFTAADARDVVTRTKSGHDSATPSGNGVLAEVMARLFHLTGEDRYRRRAEEIFTSFAHLLHHDIVGLATVLNAWETLADMVQIVIVADPADSVRKAMIDLVASLPLPDRVLTLLSPLDALPAGHPAHGKAMVNGTATVYVCRGVACSLPVTTVEALQDALGRG